MWICTCTQRLLRNRQFQGYSYTWIKWSPMGILHFFHTFIKLWLWRFGIYFISRNWMIYALHNRKDIKILGRLHFICSTVKRIIKNVNSLLLLLLGISKVRKFTVLAASIVWKVPVLAPMFGPTFIVKSQLMIQID